MYHCENLLVVKDEYVNKCNIDVGNYDILSKDNINIPSYFDMGSIYMRLIVKLSKDENEYIDKLIEVTSSWLIEKIDNYKSNLYYENPNYIYNCFLAGKIL